MSVQIHYPPAPFDFTTIPSRQFTDQYIYNSSGAQSGIRYNDWEDLCARIQDNPGIIRIIFEQNETLPAVSCDMTNVTWYADAPGSLGAPVITLPTGFTLTGWAGTSGPVVKSTSTSPIMDISSGLFLFIFERGTEIYSDTGAAPFFSQTGGIVVFGIDGAIFGKTGKPQVLEVDHASALCIFSVLGNNSQIVADQITGTAGFILIQVANTSASNDILTTATTPSYSGGISRSLTTHATNLAFSDILTTKGDLLIRSGTTLYGADRFPAGTNGYVLTPDSSEDLGLKWDVPRAISGSPASNATGTAGEIRYDGSFFYVCTGTDTWARAALTGGY